VRSSVRNIVVVLAFALSSSPLLAQSVPDKVITVTGEATASIAPDLAMVRGGVTTQGKTAQEASEANSKDMQAVIAALADAGIEHRDIQTARLSIFPQQDPSKTGKARLVGFQATNQVNVRIRDITKLPTILDRMIAGGANEISGVDFSVKDASKALDQARKEAVADAQRKAEIYAEAAGVRLGRAVLIQEEGTTTPIVRNAPMMRATASAVPIAAGEETLRAAVTISYELMH
jgi:uncharacterized protein